MTETDLQNIRKHILIGTSVPLSYILFSYSKMDFQPDILHPQAGLYCAIRTPYSILSYPNVSYSNVLISLYVP